MTNQYRYQIPPGIKDCGIRFESGLCKHPGCGSTIRITTWNADGKLSSQCVECRNRRARIRYGAQFMIG